jgi:hypothetical protein
MEEIMKTMERFHDAVDAALAQRKITNELLEAQAAIIQEQKALILELELERATLLVVLQRLRDGRAEGLKQ